jgi:hypothetical protein
MATDFERVVITEPWEIRESRTGSTFSPLLTTPIAGTRYAVFAESPNPHGGRAMFSLSTR